MPRIPPLKLDSAQFQLLLSKLDSLNNKVTVNLPDTMAVHSIDKTHTVPIIDVETWHCSWWLEVIVAPLIIALLIVGLTWWFTQRIERGKETGVKRKEYNRILNLNGFINTWLTHTVTGINDQINIFRDIISKLVNIDDEKNFPNFQHASLDIKRILEMDNEDLYRFFITTRNGIRDTQHENFYNLIFALRGSNDIIDNYKSKVDLIVNKIKEHADNPFHLYKKFRATEGQLLLFLSDLDKEINNEQDAGKKAVMQQEFDKVKAFSMAYNELNLMCDSLNTQFKYTRAKKYIWFYTKKKIEFCNNNLPVHLRMLLEIVKDGNEVVEGIRNLIQLYNGIRRELEIKISELEKMRDLIIQNQAYFNGLPLVSFDTWEEI